MFSLGKRHSHEMKELGKYYHVYGSEFPEFLVTNLYTDVNTARGTHVELNILRICTVCGRREIENVSVRKFQESIGTVADSPDYQAYIEELEAAGVVSESVMEEKFETALNYIKTVSGR
jgi:hypothetical protein